MQLERKPEDALKAQPAPEARPILQARPQSAKPDPAVVVRDVLARYPKIMSRLAE